MGDLTEATVLALLADRHRPKGGGAAEFAFLTHVRNAAGFDATREFDALALNLWPSRGHQIDIFEVKVSRADWRRELAKPDKAEAACAVADRFWIVAPAGCVLDAERPPAWGLIEVHGAGTDERPWKLRQKHAALPLTDGRPEPVGRSLVASMLRSAPGVVPGGRATALEAELRAEFRRGLDEGRQIGLDQAANAERVTNVDRDRDAESWRRLVGALEAHGVRGPSVATLHSQPEEVAFALAHASARAHLGHALDHVERALRQARTAIGSGSGSSSEVEKPEQVDELLTGE